VSGSRKLVVYHTSDVHDRRGFGAKLAAIVEPDSLLVDCGDALRGSSTVFRSVEGVLAEFAEAPYKAQAVGNREFHYLHSKMLARSRSSPVPCVCSNLVDLRDRAPVFARSLVVEVGALRVRLLALIVPQYRAGSGWERVFGWRFLVPDVALREVQASATERADVTLLLSHLGLAADRALAPNHPELAAIIGGHSHDTLARPEMVDGVPIVQPGPFADYVGRLELELGPDRPTVASYGLVPLLASESGR